MSNYEYKLVVRGTDFLWRIVETRTEHVMGEYIFEEDAQARMRFLDSGGAFNGWTPRYVLRKHTHRYETDDITK
jgi:hypothetical protein